MIDDWESQEGMTWNIAIPTDDTSITRRRRALAPIQVLTDIERTKTSLAGEFWDQYDLFIIALAVIDQVALAMGISAGRTWDETVGYAMGQAERQVPGADEDQWRKVAERVVVSLVTTDVETVSYLAHTESGPQWRAQRFRLLYVHSGEGSEYLRASEQAINIFIDALDLDIEAAQIANEAQLAALIARGAVDSAVQLARHARYRSIQYQERVRRIIADTIIDPDAHDWVVDVPALLDGALAHVRERLAAEAVLLNAVADRRTEMTDHGRVQQANQLIVILQECRRRHGELHQHLIGARTRLRESLDDRFARAPRAAHRADIARDLLAPYLARSTAAGSAIAGRILATVGGVPTRWWPSLPVLTDELCAPARAADPDDEFVAPEFDDVDPEAWWEPYEATADAVLYAIDKPVRLSAMIARADEIAASVLDADGKELDPGLLAAAFVHAAHRAWATRLAGRSADDRVVVAVTSGDFIDTESIRSADLLLVTGVVTADVNEPLVSPRNIRPDIGSDPEDDDGLEAA